MFDHSLYLHLSTYIYSYTYICKIIKCFLFPLQVDQNRVCVTTLMDHSLQAQYVAFLVPHVTCGFMEGSVKNSIYATERNDILAMKTK